MSKNNKNQPSNNDDRLADSDDGENNSQLRKSITDHLILQQTYSGPLPPSKELQGYENIEKGSAHRIISMAEKEQEHRHAMDNKILASNEKVELSGQRLGFAIIAILIISSLYAAHVSLILALALVGAPFLNVVRVVLKDLIKK